MGIELSKVTVRPAVLAVGEQGIASFTVKNTGSATIQRIYPDLHYPESAVGSSMSFVRSMPLGGDGITGVATSIARNASKDFSIAFTVAESMKISLEAYRAHSVSLRLGIMVDDSQLDTYEAVATGVATLLDKRYHPAITELTVERTPTEESASALARVKCALAAGARESGVVLTLQWRESGAASFPSGNRRTVNVGEALKGTEVSLAGPFAPGAAYAFRATLTDGYDSAASQTILAKSFANLHLAGSGHGVGIGQYSTGTEARPKFECQYPAYFYGGIAEGVGKTYSTEERLTGDKWIDGKPIYRVVVTGTTTLDGAQGEFTTLPAEPESLVDLRVYVRGGNINGWRPVPNAYYGSLGWSCAVFLNGAVVNLSFGSSWSGTREVILIAEYTKGAHEHTYGAGVVTVPATCESAGVRTYTCTGCGAVLTAAIPKTAHTAEAIPAVAATCTASGWSQGTKCAACGTILTARTAIPALGHNYQTTTIPPTATAQGYDRHVCSRCGDSYQDNYVEATGGVPAKTKYGTSLYAEADNTSASVATVEADTLVTVTGTMTGAGSYYFYPVRLSDGRTGYIHDSHLEFYLGSEIQATIRTRGPLRATPEDSGEVIIRVDAGTVVTVTGEPTGSTGFYRPVRLADGTTGYMYSSYLIYA